LSWTEPVFLERHRKEWHTVVERERTRAVDRGEYMRRLKEQRLRGKVVIRGDELPWEQSAHSRAKFYTSWTDWDQMSAPGWQSFVHDIREHSGRHRHQGGTPLFVLQGRGQTEVNNRIFDWEAGDLVILPVQAGGCAHQHFNASDVGSSRWVALIYQYAKMQPLANESVLLATSSDWRGSEEEREKLIGQVDTVDETRLAVRRQQQEAATAQPRSQTRLDALFEQRDRERAQLKTARMVVRGKDIAPELNAMGWYSWYCHPAITDVGQRAVLVWTQEIPVGSRSGKQLHQGGRLHYVWQGRGHTVIDGFRHDWQAGDEILLPIKFDGVVHQHFNDGPEPVKLVCAEANWFDMFGVDLGSGFEMIEPCPEYAHA
jgi:mannose-6-phosphate isomerase-like protein (cupin superfamily)